MSLNCAHQRRFIPVDLYLVPEEIPITLNLALTGWTCQLDYRYTLYKLVITAGLSVYIDRSNRASQLDYTGLTRYQPLYKRIIRARANSGIGSCMLSQLAVLYRMILVLLLVSVLLAATGHAQNSSTCENSFHILEQDFLSSLENRYQISRAFYPPRGPRPVVLRIHYLFPDGTNLTWYWSRAHFYLIQPLEIFQFTSLLFSSPPSQSGEVTLTLSQECATANQEIMEVLTQRVGTRAQLQLGY